MPVCIVMQDEVVGGGTTDAVSVEFDSERQTVRELIRRRVLTEVALHNQRKEELVFRGLVQPTDSERVLNGFRTKPGRQIDGEAQAHRAGFTWAAPTS